MHLAESRRLRGDGTHEDEREVAQRIRPEKSKNQRFQRVPVTSGRRRGGEKGAVWSSLASASARVPLAAFAGHRESCSRPPLDRFVHIYNLQNRGP
jgi:hypothetical protein